MPNDRAWSTESSCVACPSIRSSPVVCCWIRKDLHQSRFSGTVIAEDAKHFPACHVQGNAFQHLRLSEALGDVPRFKGRDCCFHGSDTPFPPQVRELDIGHHGDEDGSTGDDIEGEGIHPEQRKAVLQDAQHQGAGQPA